MVAEKQTSSQAAHKLLIYRLSEGICLYVFFYILPHVSLISHSGGEDAGLSGILFFNQYGCSYVLILFSSRIMDSEARLIFVTLDT